MLTTPKTNKMSVLGSPAHPDVNGYYDIWVWGKSKWSGNDVYIPWYTHEDCVVIADNTTYGHVRNIFDIGITNYWSGEGPIFITYPYNVKLTDIALNTSAATIMLYGSTADAVDTDMLRSLPINEYIEIGTYDGCVYDGTILLDAPIGTWTSPPIDIDSANVIDFVYYGSTPAGSDANFFFRTSEDGYNWTEWTKHKTYISLTITLGQGYQYVQIPVSTYITGAPYAYVYTEKYVSGTVSVYGTANSTAFARYKVMIGEGVAPDTWTDVTAWITSPVVDGVLCSIDTTSYDDGYYTLRVIVDDDTSTGPQTATADTVCVIDNTSPTVGITSPLGYVDETITVYGVVDDTNIKEWVLYFYADGGSVVTDNIIATGSDNVTGAIADIDVTEYTEGNYVLHLLGYDSAGNEASDTQAVTVDYSYPCICSVSVSPAIFSSVRIGSCDIDYVFNASGNLTIDVYDSDDVLVRNICTSKAVTSTGTETWDGKVTGGGVAEEGDYYFIVSFTIGGDTVTYTTDVVTIVNSEITCTLTSPANGDNVPKFVLLSGTVDDLYIDYYEIQYSTNGTDWTVYQTIEGGATTGYVGGIFFDAIGTYYIRLVAYDTDGNEQVSSEISVVVVDIPTADITLDNDVLTVGSYVTTTIPDIETVELTTVIPGNETYLLLSTTIPSITTVECTTTIPAVANYSVTDIQPKRYIQVKAELTRDASQTVYISDMGLLLSDNWFEVATISNTGSNCYSIYSEDLKHLALLSDDEFTVYEFIELFKI